jgi:hypothetical protein
MRRLTWTTLILMVGLFSTPEAAQAQYTNPNSRARVSPYLNLLRGGAAPGVNYYALVRPDIEYRASINQLAQQTQANQQAIATGLDAINASTAGAFITGTAVGFQTHGSFFQNIGSAGQLGFGIGGGQGGLAGGRQPAARGVTPQRGGRR